MVKGRRHEELKALRETVNELQKRRGNPGLSICLSYPDRCEGTQLFFRQLALELPVILIQYLLFNALSGAGAKSFTR